MRILIMTLILGTLAPGLLAHAGHDHGAEPAPMPKPSPSSEHSSVSGRLFEVVLERCEADKVNLYVCDNQTNQPIEGADVDVAVSGDISLKSKAEVSKSPGVYVVSIKVNEGKKVPLELKIATPQLSETLSLIVPQWPKPSSKCTS